MHPPTCNNINKNSLNEVEQTQDIIIQRNGNLRPWIGWNAELILCPHGLNWPFTGSHTSTQIHPIRASSTLVLLLFHHEHRSFREFSPFESQTLPSNQFDFQLPFNNLQEDFKREDVHSIWCALASHLWKITSSPPQKSPRGCQYYRGRLQLI